MTRFYLFCSDALQARVHSIDMTFFSRWRFYLLPLTASGGRTKSEQCSLLYRSGHSTLGRESHETSQHACTAWCIPVPARHVGYISLYPAWIESSLAVVIKNFFDLSSDQSCRL